MNCINFGQQKRSIVTYDENDGVSWSDWTKSVASKIGDP